MAARLRGEPRRFVRASARRRVQRAGARRRVAILLPISEASRRRRRDAQIYKSFVLTGYRGHAGERQQREQQRSDRERVIQSWPRRRHGAVIIMITFSYPHTSGFRHTLIGRKHGGAHTRGNERTNGRTDERANGRKKGRTNTHRRDAHLSDISVSPRHSTGRIVRDARHQRTYVHQPGPSVHGVLARLRRKKAYGTT